MRNGIASVMVMGLLFAGTALAQTGGPSVGADIVPLTGPSPAPGAPMRPRPTPVAAPVLAVPAKSAGIRPDAPIAKPATASPSARKVAHKPGTKAVGKKTSVPKRAAKTTARPGKPTHVATAKRPAPDRQTTVSAPTPLAKPTPASKSSAPPKPVLPRV